VPFTPEVTNREMLAMPKDDTPNKLIGRLQILLLVGLDHQFMHQHDVAIRQRLDRLQAEIHNDAAVLVDLHQTSASRDAIDALVYRGTHNIQVAQPSQLPIVLCGEHFLQQSFRLMISKAALIFCLAKAPLTTIKRKAYMEIE
jgi:hypothetical protein